MKKFKKMDTWVSFILLPLSIALTLFEADNFFIGYFIVGGWHIISIIVHQWKEWFTEKGSQRRHYHTAILVLLLLVLIPVVNFFVLLILLFVAPFMAFYYTWLCYNEVYVKMRRPLSLLK